MVVQADLPDRGIVHLRRREHRHGEPDHAHRGTAYTFKAYDTAGCDNADEIATETFTTLTVTLTASAVTATTATLTISNHTAAWWYKQTSPVAGACTSVAANTATASLTELTSGTVYTYAAYSYSGCSTPLDSAVFTTPGPALSTAQLIVPEGSTDHLHRAAVNRSHRERHHHDHHQRRQRHHSRHRHHHHRQPEHLDLHHRELGYSADRDAQRGRGD